MVKQQHELPTVRIQKVVLENFKSVEYGVVEMACGKTFVPHGTQSDILGLYGQNGSGKTALIEALSILKFLITGESIPDGYSDCIRVGHDKARIEFTFDYQYDNGDIRKVIYDVDLIKEEPYIKDNIFLGFYMEEKEKIKKQQFLVKVSREEIKVSGSFKGEKLKLQSIINTKSSDCFEPASKRKEFIKDNLDLNILIANRAIAWNMSKSFIFMEDSMRIFKKKEDESDFVNMISDLQFFGLSYLYVIDTKSSGWIRLNVALPLIFRRKHRYDPHQRSIVFLNIDSPNKLSEETYNEMKEVFSNINVVLNKLIPDLNIDIKDLGPGISSDKRLVRFTELVSIRNGVELPLRYESDGIKNIISTLQLFIEAFNERSMTVAIDEFDSGVFEYLLGEMLNIFAEYGQGQFIFTSHNLRPLEVLDKKFICFTTTNPANRYLRLANIKPNNNMRKVYYSEIELGGGEETLYTSEKKFKIIQAMRKAGGNGKESKSE